MGFFDDLSTMFTKGTDAAGRVADTASLKLKLTGAESRRRMAAAALGESLYGIAAADPALSAGREELLANFAAALKEYNDLQAEIDRIAAEAEAARAASVVYACPVCGASVSPTTKFCPDCGTPLKAPQPPVDPGVQAPVNPAVQQAPESPQPAPQAYQPAAAPQDLQPGHAPAGAPNQPMQP